MVMIAPVDRDVDETQHVTQEDRYRLLERAEVGSVRRLHLEHHDRDDDGDHAITEGNDPVLFHGTCFPRRLPDILTMTRQAPGRVGSDQRLCRRRVWRYSNSPSRGRICRASGRRRAAHQTLRVARHFSNTIIIVGLSGNISTDLHAAGATKCLIQKSLPSSRGDGMQRSSRFAVGTRLRRRRRRSRRDEAGFQRTWSGRRRSIGDPPS